ncbi:adenylate cyclase [candidate division WOR-3 bacterium]|nr:adenylate cyclase [candidate division WOR-3 bacterium]
MFREIERKFRITCVPKRFLKRGQKITQGYLSYTPEVRVRIAGTRSYLTVKSIGALIRREFEYRIPLADAKDLLRMCKNHIIKTRYRSHGFDIDVYHGPLHGLIVAECELASPRQQPHLPEGITGYDVTGDARYKNRNLCRGQRTPALSRHFRSC